MINQKAKTIFDALIKAEFGQRDSYQYLAMCMTQYGYENAAKYFFDQSIEEWGHGKQLISYLQGRGYEPEMPELSRPDSDVKDLMKALDFALEMEVETTDLYDTCARQMFDIDMLSFDELMKKIRTQSEGIAKLTGLIKRLEGAKDIEDQKEFDNFIFTPPTPLAEIA